MKVKDYRKAMQETLPQLKDLRPGDVFEIPDWGDETLALIMTDCPTGDVTSNAYFFIDAKGQRYSGHPLTTVVRKLKATLVLEDFDTALE